MFVHAGQESFLVCTRQHVHEDAAALEDERKLPLQVEAAYIAFDPLDGQIAGFGLRPLQHGGNCVETCEIQAVSSQGDGYAPGSAAQFQDRASSLPGKVEVKQSLRLEIKVLQVVQDGIEVFIEIV
jgi:hypothetical protein